MRLIINITDETPAGVALTRVRAVIRMGRISNTRGVYHYCHHTSFSNGSDGLGHVEASITKTGSDTFMVWTDNPRIGESNQ